MYFVTKVWGFGEPSGPLPFNSNGNRARAVRLLSPGDRVLLVTTKTEQVDEDLQGMVVAAVEPTTVEVSSFDFDIQTRPRDINARGEYKWPYGLMLKRAWAVDPPVPFSEVSSRTFSMAAVTSIVPLDRPDEVAHADALTLREVDLLAPRPGKLGKEEQQQLARSKSSPGVALIRRGWINLRHAPAWTYAMQIGNQNHWKIGWAFDPERRRRDFEHAAMPSLGGLAYRVRFREHWNTAKQAWRMEQQFLRHFDTRRSPHNHEVLFEVLEKDLSAVWLRIYGDLRKEA